MAIVKPIAKSVYVCDEVTFDPQSGKLSLLNIWDTIRVPQGAGFPYRLAKICVFAWLRDGFGKIDVRVVIVEASSEMLIRKTKAFTLEFPDRTVSIYANYRIDGCNFPAPGDYYVELYCEDEFVDDQVIRVLAS